MLFEYRTDKQGTQNRKKKPVRKKQERVNRGYSFDIHLFLVRLFFCSVVRVEGLEPPCREAPDPKSGVSTNFTTPAGSAKRNGKWVAKVHVIAKRNPYLSKKLDLVLNFRD